MCSTLRCPVPLPRTAVPSSSLHGTPGTVVPPGVSGLGPTSPWTAWTSVPLSLTANGTTSAARPLPRWTRARVAALLDHAWPPATVRTLAGTRACPNPLLAPVRRWAVDRLARTATDDDLVLVDTVALLHARGAWPATAPETRAIAQWVLAHAACRADRPGVLRGLTLLAHWVPQWSPRTLARWLAQLPATPPMATSLWECWLRGADAPWHASILASHPLVVNVAAEDRRVAVLSPTHPAHVVWCEALARVGASEVVVHALAVRGAPPRARTAWLRRLAHRDPRTFVQWIRTHPRDAQLAPPLPPRRVARWLQHPVAAVRLYAIQATAATATPTVRPLRPLLHPPQTRPARALAGGLGRG